MDLVYVKQIEDAIGTGQLLGVIYAGGSQPGTFRRLLPLQINGGQLRARCYTSNAVKTFALDKIRIIEDTAGMAPERIQWSAKPRSIEPAFFSIDEIANYYRPSLENARWVVTVERNGDGTFLELREHLKNGKTRKRPSIVLSFESVAYDLAVTPDGGTKRVNRRPRVRPWGLHSKLKTSSWTHVGSAIEAFLSVALTKRTVD